MNATPTTSYIVNIPFASLTFAAPTTISDNIIPIVVNAGQTIVINGQGGGTTIDGANFYRGLTCFSGQVTLNNMIVQNVKALGGTGGNATGGGGGGGMGAGAGIYVGPGNSVTLNTTTISNALAAGGNGGNSTNTSAPTAGGGGAGMGGNGGTGTAGGGTPSGGAGGGLFGTGGAGVASGGGPGGGGLIGNGGNGGGAGWPFGTGGGGGGSTGNGGNGGGSSGGAGGAAAGTGGAGGNEQPTTLPFNGVSGGNFGGGGGGGGGGGNGNQRGGNGGTGGLFGGGGVGGVGIHTLSTPGVGGYGGGGAAADGTNASSAATTGAAGGFGGGGGGGGSLGNGSPGGASPFGGGGGGGSLGGGGGASTGSFGGAGGSTNGGGGGGAGLGGSIFIHSNGASQSSFIINDSNAISGGSVSAGSGGTSSGGLHNGSAGQALGADIFMMANSQLTFNLTTPFSLTSAIIGDNGAGGGSTSTGGLSKTGAGTLTLGGVGVVSTYTGTNSITGGTVIISADTNLGALANPVTINAATLQTNATTSSARTFSMPGNATFTPATATTFTISGGISGAGELLASGAGTLALTNTSNTYTGGTSVTAGTLSIAADGSLGTSSVTLPGDVALATSTTLNASGNVSSAATRLYSVGVSPGSTFTQTSSGITHTIAGTISGGLLIQGGPGTLSLTNASANTYTGGTTINGGTLAFSADNNLGTGAVTIASGAIFNATNTATSARTITSNNGIFAQGGAGVVHSISSAVAGTSVTQSGPGTLTLGASNTYSGPTTVSAGTLNFTAGGNLLSGSSLNANGGTTDFSTYNGAPSLGDLNGSGSGAIINLGGNTLAVTTTGADSYAGVIQGSGGSFNKQGATQLTLGGNNTYTGTTTLTAGTLTLGGSNASATTTVTAGTLNFTASGSLLSGGNLNANGGTTDFSTYSGSPTLGDLNGSGGGAIINLGSNPLAVTTTGTDSFAGSIQGSGSFNKQGSSQLTLGGNNTYTGTTTVTAGTLTLGGTNASTTNTVTAGTLNFALAGTGSLLTGSNLQANGGTTDFTSYNGNPSLGDLTGTGSGASINLGTKTLAVTTTATDIYAGSIQGTGSFNKQGTTQLTLGGNNTFTGTTTLTAGTLTLGGSNASATTTVTTGTLNFTASGSLLSGSDLNANGGTSDFSTYNGSPTLGNLSGGGSVAIDFNTLTVSTGTYSGVMSGSGGSLIKQGAGIFTMQGANTYDTDTTINNGTLTLSGAGSLVSPVNVNSATSILNIGVTTSIGDLSGVTGSNVTLGANALTINTTSASTFAGDISGVGGAINLLGSGSLNLTALNTYTGGATVGGTSTLFVNGSTQSGVTVNNGGTLGGAGAVGGTVTINSGGLMSPGNSIGTITINGNYNQTAGSMLLIEISPTQADEIIVNGSATIQSNTTIEIMPTPGTYSPMTSFVLIHTTGGLTGQFTTVINTFPTFKATLDYTATDLLLMNFTTLPFAGLGFSGNAEGVANALDQINPAAGTDLGDIVAALRFLSLDQLEAALDQMQPSIFKGLAISQQNAMVRIKDPFFYRMHEYFWVDCIRDCCPPCPKADIWAIAIGDYAEQKSVQTQNGFRDLTAGVAAGIDFGCFNGAFFGTGVGYTYTNIHWSANSAKGNINSGYAGLYGGYFNDVFYIDALALAAYNHYEASRKLVSPVFNRVAHNQHNGFTLDGSVGAGFLITKWPLQVRPFDQFDYIYLWEDSFNEHGAGGLDLHVQHAKSTMFRNEVGLAFAKCLLMSCWKFVPELKASWIYERRFQGRHYTAEFIGTTVPFVVSGMKPIRSLWSIGFAVAGYHNNDNLLWSFYWDSEYGEHFMDQNVGLEVSYRF